MPGWHHNDLTAAAGAPPLSSWVFPTAYVFKAQGTLHVAYPSNGHIHELWRDNNGWHHNDLTIAAGAPEAQWVRNPAGYVLEVEGTQHLVYFADYHIHELWWNASGWHHNDLTAVTGGPRVMSDPKGYAFEAQGTQHVIYSGTDQHIHELWWDNSGWHRNDLTISAGAPEVSGPKSWPAAYVFNALGEQHVVYRSADDHIHELWRNNSGWHFSDLTIMTGAPLSGSGPSGDPTGYAFEAQGTQHVVYMGADLHVHELLWDSSGWHHNDLTIASGAATGFGSPRGYVFDAYGEQHVVYWGEDWGIYELWWNNTGWHFTDLLVAARSPALGGAYSAPQGYVFDAQGTEHVVYCSRDKHIHELKWAPFRIYELRSWLTWWESWNPFRRVAVEKVDSGFGRIGASGKISDIQRGRNAVGEDRVIS